MIIVTPNIHLQDNELHFQFILASGPGGQNVNKVATAVQLRFDVAHSRALSDDVRARVMRLAGSRLTRQGELVITARRFRTRERNRQDAIERLAALLRKASEKPKPRMKTRPSLGAKKRRLDDKRRRADRKRERGPVKVDI